MNQEQAKRLARAVKGEAVQSGGDVWTVELKGVDEHILVLSVYGWLVYDGEGNDVLDSEVD